MRYALPFALYLAACGTLPSAEPTAADVVLTSGARRLDVGSLPVVDLCAGSTGCEWEQTEGGTRCEWFAEHSSGEWWCKVDDDGNVFETLCALGGEYCYPPTVVDSWAECGRRAERYACGDDLT